MASIFFQLEFGDCWTPINQVDHTSRVYLSQADCRICQNVTRLAFLLTLDAKRAVLCLSTMFARVSICGIAAIKQVNQFGRFNVGGFKSFYLFLAAASILIRYPARIVDIS